jgi:hypothetical protein
MRGGGEHIGEFGLTGHGSSVQLITSAYSH